MLVNSKEILNTYKGSPYYNNIKEVLNDIILQDSYEYNCERAIDYGKVLHIMCEYYRKGYNACRTKEENCPLKSKDCDEITQENIAILNKWIKERRMEKID